MNLWQNFVLFVGLLSRYVICDCSDINWVHRTDFQSESRSISNVTDRDILQIYHCRVNENGTFLAGQTTTENNFESCLVNGQEYENNFEILTNPTGTTDQSRAFDSSQPISFDILQCLTYTAEEAPISRVSGHEMRIVNNCRFPLHIGIRGDNYTPLKGGFKMNAGGRKTIMVPRGWKSGRIWGRTRCGSNNCCQTGDCGSCQLHCNGLTGEPDVTLAEFGMDAHGNQDYYDVSLVDAFNLKMKIELIPGTFQRSKFGNKKYDCAVAICNYDMNRDCPNELRKNVRGKTVACLSACTKFHNQEYCCPRDSPFGTPQTCKSSRYAAHFKRRCPLAYSYAYDDQKSTFTCRGAPNRLTGYITTFCP